MLLSRIGERIIERPRCAMAGWLIRRGVHPNHLTVLGLVLTLPVGIALARGQWRLAVLLMAVAGTCDFLDGEVARQGNLKTRFGAFLDSTLDRYADLILCAGLAIAFWRTPWIVAVVFAVLVGSLMTSYTRARAESLVEGFHCGFFERADRILVLMAGCLFHLVVPALLVIAVLSNAAAIQRILYTRRRLQG